MSSTYLLLLIVLTSAMSAVVAFRGKALDWVIVNTAFVLAGGVGYMIAPARAGLWLVVPWLVFAIAPLVAFAQINRLLLARRMGAARVLARVAYVLHPSASSRRLVRVNEAYVLASAGKLDEAAAILRESEHAPDLELEVLRLHSRWADILAYIEADGPDPLAHRAAVLYLRALGETGQLDRFVDAYRTLAGRWATRDEDNDDLATIRLFAASFLGQPALVEAMFAGPQRHFSPSIQQYWRAIAHDAGGDRTRAAAIWAELTHDEEARTRSAAEYRAAHPVARIDAPGPAARELIAELARDVRDAATYAGKNAHAPRPLLSYAIVALLVAVHGYLTWRMQRDPEAIYDLGMFWSPAVLHDGEWWRLVTATLLHAGWMHLAMNVLGLLWFGPFVERFLGRVRFAIVYVLGGVGGFALLTLLDSLHLHDPAPTVGASGSIMALIGASIAIFLRGSSRSPIAAKRLRDMLGFVGFQFVFDVFAPRVSLAGHLTGLAIGFLLGLVVARRHEPAQGAGSNVGS